MSAEEEQSSVDVEISEDVALDVRPTEISYTDGNSLEPGEVQRESDEDFEHLELENIGSEPLDEIFAEADMHENNAFADPGNDHSTGNFITVSTEQATADGEVGGLNDLETHHYVNRVEYFENTPPTYIQVAEESVDVDGVTIDPDESATQVGRFRVGDVEYFFVLYEDDSADDVGIRIGDTPHTSTDLGTFDFTGDDGDYSEYTPDDTEASDVFDIEGQELLSFDSESENFDEETSLITDGGEDAPQDLLDEEDTEVRQYDMYFDTDGELVVRTSVNVFPSHPDGSSWELDDQSGLSSSYLVDAADEAEDEALQPGQNMPLDVGVQVPLGVDQDTVTQGSITVQASAFE